MTGEIYGWKQDLPMTLLEQLKTDLKTSMKNKDVTVRDTVRLIMAEFPKLTVPLTLESGKKTTRPKKPEEITDDDIVDIVKGLIKSEKTVLEIKGEDASPYLRILESYLPRMIGPAAIEAWIRENIDFSGLKSPMQAMGPIMKHFGNTADGNTVREILSRLLKK